MSDLEQLIRKLVTEAVREELARQQEPANDQTTYVSTGEAARIAGVSIYTIRRWVHAGELTKHVTKGRMRINRAELERYLACEVVPIDSKLSMEDRIKRRFG